MHRWSVPHSVWAALPALALVLLSLGCCGSDMDYAVDPVTGERTKVIKMGLVPSEDAEIVIAEGEKMADLLREMTGITFRTYVTPNYNTLIAAMRAGDVDFAWLPPLAYAKSRLDGTGTVLLKAVRGDNPFYYGAIIVRKDSGYRSISDLKGKLMGWGDILSFSGHIYPKYDLIENGIYTEGFFGKEMYLASHPAVVAAVLNGHVDAGSVWANDTEGVTGAWHQLERQEDRDAITAIYYTKPIPGDTFTVRSKFMQENPELVKKVTQAVMDMGRSERGHTILKTVYRIDLMVPTTDTDYKVVYDAFELVMRR